MIARSLSLTTHPSPYRSVSGRREGKHRHHRGFTAHKVACAIYQSHRAICWFFHVGIFDGSPWRLLNCLSDRPLSKNHSSLHVRKKRTKKGQVRDRITRRRLEERARTSLLFFLRFFSPERSHLYIRGFLGARGRPGCWWEKIVRHICKKKDCLREHRSFSLSAPGGPHGEDI
jgi:hypothetical protein